MRSRRMILMRVLAVCAAIVFFGAAVPRIPAVIISETEVSLQLLPGEKNSSYNLDQINALCSQGTEQMKIVIRIAQPGVYYVGTEESGRAILLRSNVTLDLNGSTLVRAEMMDNMIQNCDMEGNRTGGGYELSHNITVRNGTLDGVGGADVNANLVNIGHARNVRLENLILKNCQGAHLIELSGCMDAVISNCTFDGYVGDQDGAEAVQLDISYNGTGQNWNGVYTGDGTVCRNITVTDCTFHNYPSGVGNHHSLSGQHNQNITIKNNLFLNQADAAGTAIWCYEFDGCTVADNIIAGNYLYGIRVSGGSDIMICDNIVGTMEYPMSGQGIYFTLANSYVKDQGRKKQAERVAGASVADNRVYVTGESNYGIFVCNGSVLNEIVGNVIYSGVADGIRVTGQGSTVTSIGRLKKDTGNMIVAEKGWGIAFGKEAEGLRIVGNTIYSGPGGDGIQIASGSYMESIGTEKYPNMIESAGGNGIVVTGTSTAAWISYNQITAQEGVGILTQKESLVDSIEYNVINPGSNMGIAVTLDAQVRDIFGNKIREYLNNGIYTSSSAGVVTIRKNVISGGTGAGIYITNSKVSDSIQGNKISNCKSENGHGINVTSTGTVKKIKANTITKTEGYGIKVTGPSASVKLMDNKFKQNALGDVCLNE